MDKSIGVRKKIVKPGICGDCGMPEHKGKTHFNALHNEIRIVRNLLIYAHDALPFGCPDKIKLKEYLDSRYLTLTPKGGS